MATNARERKKKYVANAKAETGVSATAKYIRISPYKIRPVLDLIRGKKVTEAEAMLENIPKAGSEPIDKAELYVKACYADQGPTLKRMQPMAHGRGFRILKRTSHITVVVDNAKAE